MNQVKVYEYWYEEKKERALKDVRLVLLVTAVVVPVTVWVTKLVGGL